MSTPFSKLKFGEAAAEAEAVKNPALLVNSFYDRWEAEEKIDVGDAYLLIGPKGSGKSTVLEYLKLRSQDPQSQTFVTINDLGSLHQSVETDPELSRASEAQRTQMSWKLYLWSALFDSLMSDNGCSLSSDPDCVKLHRQLKEYGLISGDFRTVIQEVRKRKHKFNFPKIYSVEIENDGKKDVLAPQLAGLLEQIVTNARTGSRHILGLDGLDSTLIGSANYWAVLAHLLRAANDVHAQLLRASSRIRICLLCRSDVFIRIELPDSNKIRQSWGIELDWTYGTDNARDSYLWDLVEKKARSSGAQLTDIIRDYFPAMMAYGNTERPMPEYLMQLTRQTPRDILMLFRKIAEQSSGAAALDIRRIRAGANKYCADYFAGEITNELSGLVPQGISSRMVSSFGRLERRKFSRGDFASLFGTQARDEGIDLDQLLQQLFLAGAIANLTYGRNSEYVQFYHRRSYSEINPKGPFLLHSALALGLNVPFS